MTNNEQWGLVCYTTDPSAVRDAARVLGIKVTITSVFHVHGDRDIYSVSAPKRSMGYLREQLLVRHVDTPNEYLRLWWMKT